MRVSVRTSSSFAVVIPGSPILHNAWITSSAVGLRGSAASPYSTSGFSRGRPTQPSPISTNVPATQNTHGGGTGSAGAHHPAATPVTAPANKPATTSPSLRPGISVNVHTNTSTPTSTPHHTGAVHASSGAPTSATAVKLRTIRSERSARRSLATDTSSFASFSLAWYVRSSAAASS